MLGRNTGLDLEGWVLMGRVLQECSCLVEVVDFQWSSLIFARSVSDLDLERQNLGDLEASVLSAFLPRTASTLTALRLRFSVAYFLSGTFL